jgi:phosphatidylserine/phosphatidylglycerophosphate/cardiolipin synthase-like enzyme
MDEALAIERITETENLTDGLDDDDANWLLQWGTGHAGGLIAGIADEEAAGEKVNQLMAVMRSLNAVAADRTVKDPAGLGDDIRALRERYAATFGSTIAGDEGKIARLSVALPTLTPREAMQQVLALLEAPTAAPAPPTLESGGPTAAVAPVAAPPRGPGLQLPPQPPAAHPARPQAPPNRTQPIDSPRGRLHSLRRRVLPSAQTRRGRRTLLIGVVSALTAIAVLIALLIGPLRRQAPAPPATVEIATPSPDITVYFTEPSSQISAGLDQLVVADLDGAKKTIDVASFDFNLPSVTNALARAERRGVAVRVVLDEKNGTQILRASDSPEKKQFNALDALGTARIPVVDGGRATGLMHNKFILIDDAILFVGSSNLSYNDTFRNNNNLLRITNATLIANYQARFNEMFVARRFGTNATVGTLAPRLMIDGATVENYFSPRDRVMRKLVTLVSGARKSVHFLAFTYTNPDLAAAMIARARVGVQVQAVIENRGASQGALPSLFCNSVAVQTDGNQYTMHDKVIILDGQTVITGSYNFTQTADKYNDDNVVVLHDPALAGVYEHEFARIVAEAKQPSALNCAATPVLTPAA